MKYPAENAVSSFFFYMWNGWNENECRIVFSGMHKHFWDKWCGLADSSMSTLGAAERFYAELSDNYREMLVNRAVAVYDGNSLRKQPEHSDVLVCEECGSIHIEVQAWVNANTDEFISDVENDNNGQWCNECENHTGFCSLDKFKQKMQHWWESADDKTFERTTGLKKIDYPPKNGLGEFIGACNEWWNSLDYEDKRTIYKKEQS